MEPFDFLITAIIQTIGLRISRNDSHAQIIIDYLIGVILVYIWGMAIWIIFRRASVDVSRLIWLDSRFWGTVARALGLIFCAVGLLAGFYGLTMVVTKKSDRLPFEVLSIVIGSLTCLAYYGTLRVCIDCVIRDIRDFINCHTWLPIVGPQATPPIQPQLQDVLDTIKQRFGYLEETLASRLHTLEKSLVSRLCTQESLVLSLQKHEQTLVDRLCTQEMLVSSLQEHEVALVSRLHTQEETLARMEALGATLVSRLQALEERLVPRPRALEDTVSHRQDMQLQQPQPQLQLHITLSSEIFRAPPFLSPSIIGLTFSTPHEDPCVQLLIQSFSRCPPPMRSPRPPLTITDEDDDDEDGDGVVEPSF